MIRSPIFDRNPNVSATVGKKKTGTLSIELVLGSGPYRWREDVDQGLPAFTSFGWLVDAPLNGQ